VTWSAERVLRWSPEREALFDEYRRLWTAAGLATGAADRERAERGVRHAYAAAGLAPPERFVWLGSPMQGGLAAALAQLRGQRPPDLRRLLGAPREPEHLSRLAALADRLRMNLAGQIARRLPPAAGGWGPAETGAPVSIPIRQRLRDRVAAQVRREVDGQVSPGAGARLLRLLENRLSVPVGAAIGTRPRWPWQRLDWVLRRQWDDLCRDLVERVDAPPPPAPGLVGEEGDWDRIRWAGIASRVRFDGHALRGQQDADWLATFDLCARACGLASARRLDGVAEVARSAGWWWPFERAAILTERPVRVRLDDQGLAHADDGPAVEYPDGWGLWAWHGAPVSRRVIEAPESLSLTDVLGRWAGDVPGDAVDATIERIGVGRFLELAGGRRVAEDEAGALWRLTALPGERLACVPADPSAGREARWPRRVHWASHGATSPRSVLAELRRFGDLGWAWEADRPAARRPREPIPPAPAGPAAPAEEATGAEHLLRDTPGRRALLARFRLLGALARALAVELGDRLAPLRDLGSIAAWPVDLEPGEPVRQALLAEGEARLGAAGWPHAFATVRDEVEDPVRALVEDGLQAVWQAARAQVRALVWRDAELASRLGREARREARTALLGRLGGRAAAQAASRDWRIATAYVERLVEGVPVWIRGPFGGPGLSWLAGLDFFDRAADMVAPRRLRGQMEVARSAGGWLPLESVLLLYERPLTLGRDERGRLHSGSGPAVLYPDGWGLWAWHGVRVPRRVIEAPDTLRPADVVGEENAEVRRVMIERLGHDRFLRDAGAVQLSRDEAGVLWRVELDEAEPLVYVEVTNATPAPEGGHRRHFLRVPPEVGSPHEAVAWTFGLRPEEYRPSLET
jgi:hypothetical protein